MSKHSPGPWKWGAESWDNRRLSAADGSEVLHHDPEWMGDNVTPPNRRLIAAAPEMLELLREVAPLLRTLARRMPDVVGLTEDDGETPVSRVERLLARIDGKETP